MVKKKVANPAFQDAMDCSEYEVLKEMIENGLDVNTKESFYGRTMLMAAVAGKEFEFVRYLLTHSADVNIQDKANWTALHFAAQDQDVEILELLIKNGANINAQDKHGNTPVGRAATFNTERCIPAVRILLKYGADRNIKNHYDVAPAEAYADVFVEADKEPL